ncbi:Bacterial extracellular solute-binding proteins, family 3 [Aquimixticola soesokkakensis]|uniref:Bacterial extracellular solute-binding proteins, family 3 n=1 Tax=Aquimixticola soesokkakensis TaxID=1519096 RepID=A0A1Y5TES6_9RHOB|nr:transporter substrate-binding domain-containing protein [Aquimixticola soesokkakensis]SLN62256.1 Bacterial extracellular solute-binding proteins, family 3 [Aquimixticola soesokkakensis]
MTGIAPALRVGFNLNNTALVQKTATGYTGVAPDLARRIAEAAGRALVPVDYPNARSAVEAVGDGWDIAFLALDPARADRMCFSTPYHSVSASFAVPNAHPAQSCTDVLHSATPIASPKGAAFHTKLVALTPQGPLHTAPTPAEARALFEADSTTALAGIRDTLLAANLVGCRVLSDEFARIEQAIALPKGADALLALVNEIVESFLHARATDP